MTMTIENNTFTELGLGTKMVEILTRLNFTVPTPIQRKSIPHVLAGEDMIGIAQTGTGKTFAFGLPLIKKLEQLGGQILILVPTRELALQADESLRRVGKFFDLRTAVVMGGENANRQVSALRRDPHIIIATPGRLIDLANQKLAKLNNIKVLVLDEADTMFDMGFAPQVTKIIAQTPRDRQTLLFSATMPPSIAKLVAVHMHLPVTIEVAPQGTTADRVDQEMYILNKEDKLPQLKKIMESTKGSVLVFCRTKHGAKNLAVKIRHEGIKAAEIHSNLSLPQRRKALDGFKSGLHQVLIGTDIAARGIDVKNIELVVNFDLPSTAEDYVHRIGRTGRAGKSGLAISFATPDQGKEIIAIEKLIKKSIKLIKLAQLDMNPTVPAKQKNRSGKPRVKQNFSRVQTRRANESAEGRSPHTTGNSRAVAGHPRAKGRVSKNVGTNPGRFRYR